MIKSRLAKNIVSGLIFSIIFGLVGLYLHKKLVLDDSTVTYKKLYVLETAIENLNKFRNMNIPDRRHYIIDHFYSSIQHSSFMLNRTNQISTCKDIKIHAVDLSIVLESPSFLKKDEEHVVSCLSELILKSFQRFKEKVIVIIEDAILYKKLSLKKLRLEELERENQIEEMMKEREKNSSIYILEKSLCSGIDVLFKDAIADVDAYLKNNEPKDNKAEKPIFIGNFLSLDYLIDLSKRCNKDMQTLNFDNKIIQSDLEALRSEKYIARSKEASLQINEINNQIRDMQEFISSAKLEDLFNLQKRTVEDRVKRRERYLTETQTLVTFLILGFIVGLILSSNFLAVSKKDK